MITGIINSNSPTGLRHAGFASILQRLPIINVSSDFRPSTEMEIKNILTKQNQMLFRIGWLTAILVMKINSRQFLFPEQQGCGYDGTYFIEEFLSSPYYY